MVRSPQAERSIPVRSPAALERERYRAGAARSYVAAALTALLAVPVLVALVAYREPPWVPILDHAQTELRVRDVGTIRTPLVGLTGRVGGTLGRPGSHPGPLSFYLLAPVYRLLGSTSWALQAASVTIQIAAIAVALLIAGRRAGPMLVVGVAAALAVLTTGYGTFVLAEPWNPYLPVLWWVVFLLAVWSVACGDLPMLPVVVAAGTFCAQTHVPYLPLTVGLGAAAAAVVAVRWWTLRRDPHERRSLVRWSVVAAIVGVVLWIPPTIDQLIHDPGNYRVLITHFTHPPTMTAGWALAARLVSERVDVVHLLVDQFRRPGILVGAWPGHVPIATRGAVYALVWLVSAAVAVVLRHRALVRLHAVVAVALLLAVYALSRLFGTVWFYLMLWVWGIATVMAIAIGWTIAAAVARLVAPERQRGARALATAALLALTLAFVIRFSVAATHPVHMNETGEGLLRMIDTTARALDEGVGYATGRDARYLVLWTDVAQMGGPGYALLNELERRGFHVGVPKTLRTYVNGRVVADADAAAEVVFASGAYIARWATVPGAAEVAYYDGRSIAERREYEDLRTAAIADLRAAGLRDLVLVVDRNLFAVALDPRVSASTRERFTRMLQLGVATAVFIVPPGVRVPPPS